MGSAAKNPLALKRRRMLACMCILSMAIAAGLAQRLKPKQHLAEQLGPIGLAQSIPKNFGRWHEDIRQNNGIVTTSEELGKLYSETLSRVYVHADGYRIMLSIAYGGDQRDTLQFHYPDVCYAAQGFEILSRSADVLQTQFGPIGVFRLLTRLGTGRTEPVSYWTMVGKRQAGMGFAKKTAELDYTLRSIIPDGLVFRVSSIDPNKNGAWLWQDHFLIDLLEAVAPLSRRRFAGI